jgi:hypothetical protein
VTRTFSEAGDIKEAAVPAIENGAQVVDREIIEETATVAAQLGLRGRDAETILRQARHESGVSYTDDDVRALATMIVGAEEKLQAAREAEIDWDKEARLIEHENAYPAGRSISSFIRHQGG